jgi:hypothetical protein
MVETAGPRAPGCGQSAIVDIPTVTVQVCYEPSSGIGVLGHLSCEIVDGHRYADDAEPGWYSGQSQYARATDPETTGSRGLGASTSGNISGTTSGNIYDSGVHERPSGAFRLPEQRPYALPDAVTSTGSHARPAEPESQAAYDSVRIPVRGPEYPTIRPGGEPAPPAAPGPTTYGSSAPEPVPPMAEPTTLVPPITPGGRPRFDQPRPGPAEGVYQSRRSISSYVVAIVMVVLLIPVVRLLVESTFTGDPSARSIVPAVLLTLGFTLSGIGLFAVAGGGPMTRDSWLRPPVAYLPAGLILLLAAGLAVA